MKLIKNIILALSLGFFLYSCDYSRQPFLENLQKQNVIIGHGIQYDTGKAVVFDPSTGKRVKACPSPTYIKSERGDTDFDKGCNIELVEGDDIQFINNVIEKSQGKLSGKINNEGKVVDARFEITVTALYEGSKCTTEWHSGKQYKCCNGRQPRCKLYE